jgi:hypothetical protein
MFMDRDAGRNISATCAHGRSRRTGAQRRCRYCHKQKSFHFLTLDGPNYPKRYGNSNF